MQHRRLPPLGRHVRRGLTQAVGLTAVAGLLVVGGAGAAQVGDREDVGSSDVAAAGVLPKSEAGRLIRRYDCSTVGYDDGSTPRSAIVRGGDGKVRVVTFEQGWDIHTSATRAELVAVCLRPAP